MATFSPMRGVRKPSVTRPTMSPSQNPVAVMPLANSVPCRTFSMNRTIQPPSVTSVPT